jgi:hypothetical protein
MVGVLGMSNRAEYWVEDILGRVDLIDSIIYRIGSVLSASTRVMSLAGEQR